MKKLKSELTVLMLIAITFLSSCSGINRIEVLPPDFPTAPDFRLSREGGSWRMEHSDKVSLQRWIIEVDGYRKDCDATIKELSK